jgi:nucleoside-diphosphate-sugar epimerase
VTVLVTGAGGFLGRYVAQQLVARGESVRAFCRGRYPELEALGVELIRGDLADPRAVGDACRDVEAVFHVAGTAGIWGPWEFYHRTNTLGTRHVIAGCRQHGVRRLVFSSSPSVTFDGSAQEGIDESAPYASRWLCHYPHSKALAEQEVLAASGQNGLRTCALRPHLIWGPGDAHLVPRLLDRARRGKLRRVGDGTNLVDMVYVENAAQAHLQAADALASVADSRVAGRAYFISQGEPVRLWEWIDDILAVAGLAPVQKSISLSAAWRLGAACEAVYRGLGVLREPPMTRFLTAQLGKSHYFKIDAARHDFGYRPQIDIAQGMQRLGEALAWQGQGAKR